MKLLDFGLAKFMRTKGDIDPENARHFRGTPFYASPELASGQKNYDHRVDIYAVGVVMYRMLCGEVPFDGETPKETLSLHQKKLPVPPSIMSPKANIPKQAEEIILKSLRKNPDDRYQSMEEMKNAIENAYEGFLKKVHRAFKKTVKVLAPVFGRYYDIANSEQKNQISEA